MTDKALAARIRMLRRAGVLEFEQRGDDIRVRLAPLPPRQSAGKTSVEHEEDPEEDMTGHPSAFWREWQRRKQAEAAKASQ